MNSRKRFRLFVIRFLIGCLAISFRSCRRKHLRIASSFHFELAKYTSSVIAHNEKITPIESYNLPINALGIYDNPAFGKIISHSGGWPGYITYIERHVTNDKTIINIHSQEHNTFAQFSFQ